MVGLLRSLVRCFWDEEPRWKGVRLGLTKGLLPEETGAKVSAIGSTGGLNAIRIGLEEEGEAGGETSLGELPLSARFVAALRQAEACRLLVI